MQIPGEQRCDNGSPLGRHSPSIDGGFSYRFQCYPNLFLYNGEIDRHSICRDSRRTGYNPSPIFLHELDNGRYGTHKRGSGRDGIFHYRFQLFSKNHGHFRKSFLRLVESGLNRVVLHVVFFGDGCRLVIGLCGVFLLPYHRLDITGKSGNHLRRTCTIRSHFLKNGCEDIHTSEVMKTLQKHQQGIVS